MRSIRRTSIGYLLVLLVLALGGVSLLIDQVARDAIRAREESETDRMAADFVNGNGKRAGRRLLHELRREEEPSGRAVGRHSQS